jgi:hypothetical protein
MSSEHVTLIAAVFGFLLVLAPRFMARRIRSSGGHQRAERRELDWYGD